MNVQWIETSVRTPAKYGHYLVIHSDEELAWLCVRSYFAHLNRWALMSDELEPPLYWLEGLEFPQGLDIHGDPNKIRPTA